MPIDTVEIESRKNSIERLQAVRAPDHDRKLPSLVPEVLPLVSPCPKAAYAMGLRPVVLTYDPVRAGGAYERALV